MVKHGMPPPRIYVALHNKKVYKSLFSPAKVTSMSKDNSKSDNKNSAFEIPSYEFPKMEVPAAFREMAEKTISQGKENYDRIKSAAEETSSMLETAFSTYSKGQLELAGKVLDNTQANANAVFNFVKSLLQSKSVAEAIEKQTSFARSQFETLAAQGQEIQKLSTQIANDTSEPLKNAAEKTADTFSKTTQATTETFRKTA